MDHDKKIKYFASAMNICKYAFNLQQTDLMVRLYDLVCEKKGDANLEDIAKIQAENEERFPTLPKEII
jgi:hypothetical protein